MAKVECSCVLCRTVVTANNIPIHHNSSRCRSGRKPVALPMPQSLICQHCGKESKTLNSFRNHERLCKSNPNRQKTYLESLSREERLDLYRLHPERKISNQYLKAEELGLPKPMLADESRKKMSENTKKFSIEYWNGADKESNRAKQSVSMKKAVRENPESYSSSNRGRTKQIEKYGIKFQGSWELKFYEWCLQHQVDVVRNYEGFAYCFDGERTYFPDFYLPAFDTYVEIKGYKVDKDAAKWRDFPHDLLVIQKHEMKLIEQGLFKL